MTSRIYASSVKSESTFGRVHSVLKSSGLENYIQNVSSEEVLKLKIGELISDTIKDKQEFYELVAYLFQSITNIGYTTYEILTFICNSINSQGTFEKDEKKEIIEILKDSFCFVHTDYSDYPTLYSNNNKTILDKILFGHDEKIDYFNMGLVFGQESANIIGRSKGKFKKDIKVLSAFSGAAVNHLSSEDAKFNSLNNNFNRSSLNKKIDNPKRHRPSVSSILVSNPDIRVGTQNALELSSFFNGITTLEMNRSYPYLNARFILPSLESQTDTGSNSGGIYVSTSTSSTINSFLFGSDTPSTENYKLLAGNNVSEGIVETNMSIFTSPQTMVNMDEPIGHSQNSPSTNRRTTVNDPTQPFMTIKSFSINSAATKGLMSYKSGKLSLILHDRTRMNDIAAFVKPDLLGAFGAEILLEYGWSNPDQDNTKNPLGYFIGNSRVTEKYMIVNSSLSIDNTGLVNIDLSIAMKGPYEFKNQQISTKVKNRVQEGEFKSLIGNLDFLRQHLTTSSSEYFSKNYINKSSLPYVFSETTRINSESSEKLNEFKQAYESLYSSVSNNIGKHLSISRKSNSSNITLTFKLNSIKAENSQDPKGILINFCSILTNESLEDIKNKITGASGDSVEFELKNETISISEAMSVVSEIINTTKEMCNLIKDISLDDQIEGENENKIVQTISGSSDRIDQFYPTSQKFIKILDKKEVDYVSLGSVINTIVQSYIAKPSQGNPQFDEIQTIFYTANDQAGAMANENLAKLLINRKMLKEFLKNVFTKKAVLTPESLISQIIDQFVQTGDNITFGLSSLYEERKSYTDAIKLKNADSDSSEKISKLKISKLREIYGVGQSVPDSDISFKLPIIHMNFESLTANGLSKKNVQRTILRISVYDRSDSPFSASSEVLQSIYQGNIEKVFGSFVENRKDYKNNKRKSKKILRNDLEIYNKKQKKEIERLLAQKWIKKTNDGKYTLNYEKIQGFNNNQTKNYIGSLKDIYKQNYPSLTFGTQNSVMISANVSTINDNKLSTIFMTRSDRNDQSLINNRINKNLPLVIMPSQATVEIFGCPWVNFGQYIFLDFETGTTIDNRYVVTGITHNLSPGKFTTQLTLSYADNFGQASNLEDKINERNIAANRVKRAKRKVKQGKSGDTVRINISPGYDKDPVNVYWDSNLKNQA